MEADCKLVTLENILTTGIYNDVGLQVQDMLILLVEAQNALRPGYPLIKRAIYYCSRMISSQYGVEFSHSQYQKI